MITGVLSIVSHMLLDTGTALYIMTDEAHERVQNAAERELDSEAVRDEAEAVIASLLAELRETESLRKEAQVVRDEAEAMIACLSGALRRAKVERSEALVRQGEADTRMASLLAMLDERDDERDEAEATISMLLDELAHAKEMSDVHATETLKATQQATLGGTLAQARVAEVDMAVETQQMDQGAHGEARGVMGQTPGALHAQVETLRAELLRAHAGDIAALQEEKEEIYGFCDKLRVQANQAHNSAMAAAAQAHGAEVARLMDELSRARAAEMAALQCVQAILVHNTGGSGNNIADACIAEDAEVAQLMNSISRAASIADPDRDVCAAGSMAGLGCASDARREDAVSGALPAVHQGGHGMCGVQLGEASGAKYGAPWRCGEERMKGVRRDERDTRMQDGASCVATKQVEQSRISDGTAGHCAYLHPCGAFMTNCCLCYGAHALGEAHCYSARSTSGNWCSPPNLCL